MYPALLFTLGIVTQRHKLDLKLAHMKSTHQEISNEVHIEQLELPNFKSSWWWLIDQLTHHQIELRVSCFAFDYYDCFITPKIDYYFNSTIQFVKRYKLYWHFDANTAIESLTNCSMVESVQVHVLCHKPAVARFARNNRLVQFIVTQKIIIGSLTLSNSFLTWNLYCKRSRYAMC
mgnify:FL=1